MARISSAPITTSAARKSQGIGSARRSIRIERIRPAAMPQSATPSAKKIPGASRGLSSPQARAEAADLLPEIAAEDSSWIDYQEKYGLTLLFDSLGQVAEIHFGEAFRGRLPSRVQVGSRIQDIYDAYGTPKTKEEVPAGAEGTGDRVLYKTPQGYGISYHRLGLAFRLSTRRRVAEIIVFKPMPDRRTRIKPGE